MHEQEYFQRMAWCRDLRHALKKARRHQRDALGALSGLYIGTYIRQTTPTAISQPCVVVVSLYKW
jgi:hypothetical protein